MLPIKHRKWIDEPCSGFRTVGGIAQTVYRDLDRVSFCVISTLTTINRARLSRLLPTSDMHAFQNKKLAAGSEAGSQGKPSRLSGYFYTLLTERVRRTRGSPGRLFTEGRMSVPMIEVRRKITRTGFLRLDR